MLIGEYKHTLDPKKRIAVPAKWRKELGRKIVITHGLDNCLSVYPLKSWAGISEKLAGLSMGQSNTRGFNRFMFGGAVEAEIDNLGRVLIPDFLKDFAGLQTKAVWAGLHSHVEIWDEDRWVSYKKQIEGQADGLAQKLGEIGVI